MQDALGWARQPVERRQQAIEAFYKKNDVQHRHRFLSFVRAPHGFGVYASTGTNYQYAVFGRDSLAVANNVMQVLPELSREIILTLARLQGVVLNNAREEEPGKIHHEYRPSTFGTQPISIAAEKVLAMLWQNWGGTADELRYYGSVDATPQFVVAIARYCNMHGHEILDQQIKGYDGTVVTIRQAGRAATEWIVQRLRASAWNLLEFKRLNSRGLPYQGWKDSDKAYLHLDGTAANAQDGIASIEIQGYAHDALKFAADLWALDEKEAATWRGMAADLARQTVDQMWMPGQNFFAMGLDRTGPGGETRQIKTLTSNGAALLASELLDSHPSAKEYQAAIEQAIMGDEFLTPAGVRLRALRHQKLVSFADYHGCMVTWPCETATIARGLRRIGKIDQARELERRLLYAVAEAGEFYEFFLVNAEGAVKYHYRRENESEPTFHAFGAANVPEPSQAWTISAVVDIVDTWHREGRKDELPRLK